MTPIARRFRRTVNLERIPLGIRLGMLVGVPLVVIAAISATSLRGLWSDTAEGTEFRERVDTVFAIDEAVVSLQEERDLSVQLLTEPGDAGMRRQLTSRLTAARERTSVALAGSSVVEAIPLGQFAARPPRPDSPGPTRADGLPPERRPAQPRTLRELRELADSPTADVTVIVDTYALLFTGFIDAVMEASRVDHEIFLQPTLVAYQNLTMAGEWFAQARTVGLQILAQDEMTPNDRRLLAQLSDGERFFLEQAYHLADPTRSEELRRLLRAPAVVAADDLRAELITSQSSRPDVSRDDWLAGTDARTDALHAVSAGLLDQVTADAEAVVASARHQFTTLTILTLAIMLVVALGAWAVSYSISRPLRRLAVTARHASFGRLTEVDVPPSRDAIGEIGHAFDELNRYLHTVADAADEIARGDLEREIEPRSPEDRLGSALRSMTRQLASMVTRSRRRSETLEVTVDALKETASRDSLTGLLNRARFAELLDEEILQARADAATLGVLFVDLDGFKAVNDNHGHEAGDELLRQVALRLREVVRTTDIVGRLGGDEFTLLVRSDTDHERPRTVAQRVVDVVSHPYTIGNQEVRVSASVGLALYPDHGESTDELLRASDRAMYQAKSAGGGTTLAAA